MEPDYGTVLPLCDVRGCHEPQCGEVVELELEQACEPSLWVRVHPCRSHHGRMHRHLKSPT